MSMEKLPERFGSDERGISAQYENRAFMRAQLSLAGKNSMTCSELL